MHPLDEIRTGLKKLKDDLEAFDIKAPSQKHDIVLFFIVRAIDFITEILEGRK